MTDEMAAIKDIISDIAQKMPKDKQQALMWATEWMDKTYEEIMKCGLNHFEIIGMVDALKNRISADYNKNQDMAKKLFKGETQ